ncbi:MAG: AAA family ATPase [Deltaproteobacteria bacterium]|nr:AAA family ATPase [Deltaproteobacteria bacterium]
MLYAFDRFELDAERHELRLDGEPVDLQPKVLGLLLYLLQNRQRVVSREELFATLWPGVVVSDDALFHALKKARAAVGDDGAAQRVIETLPRVGYRFVASVEERDAATTVPGRAATPAAEPAPAPEGPPLIGRDAELARLRGALERALAGSGRVAIVSGDAGIGKTRLAREIVEIARGRGAEVSEAGSWHGPGAPPFWLWVQILRAMTRARKVEDLPRAMGESAGEIARLVPELAEKLSIEVPPVRDSDEARFLLMDAVARFLVQAARERPQILLLEDLQWAPPATLHMLAFLAREISPARLLVVGTCRAEDLPREHPLFEAIDACEQRDVLLRVPLGGLGAEVLAQLVENAAGFHPPPELVRALHAATGGNPFFAKQIVGLAAEEPTGAAVIAARLASQASGMPAGVRRVLDRRLATLSERCRTLLGVASVVGPEVTLAVLARVSDLPQLELLEGVDEALESRLLESVPERRASYRFAHALVRDAAYAGLHEPDRVRLHLRVAQALEALYAGRLEPLVPALAHHYGQAALLAGGTKAVDYAKWAGDLATLALSYEEAAAHYQRALEAFDLAPEPEGESRRAELLVCVGFARHNAGQFAGGREALREAAALAIRVGSSDLLVLAAIGFADLAIGVSDPEAVRMLEAALAGGDGQPPFLRVWLRCLLAADLMNDPGRLGDARQVIDEAEAIARSSGGTRSRAFLLCVRAKLLCMVPEGTPEVRLDLLREAERLVRDRGERWTEMLVWTQIHAVFVELGDLEQADVVCARIERIVERLRSKFWEFLPAIFRAGSLMLEGRFDAAEALARSQLSRSDSPRFEYAVTLATLVGVVRHEQGRLAELLPALASLHEQRPYLGVARAAHLLALLEAGQRAAARAGFSDLASARFEPVVEGESWLFALTLLAEVCVGLGDAESARTLAALLEPGARHYAVLAGYYCHGPVALYLGQLACAARDWTRAEDWLDFARERAEALRSPVWRAHTLAALARMHLGRGERGDKQRGREAAQAAVAIAEPLGMQRLLRDVRALGV